MTCHLQEEKYSSEVDQLLFLSNKSIFCRYWNAELIDYVDYDFNERLLLNGYKLLKVNKAKLIQEVGNAKPTWLYTPRKESDGSWKIERFYAFGHSPMRCYYKARNRIYYTKKYGKYVLNKMEGVYQIPIQMMLVLLFENNKHEKMKMFIKGIVDGTKKRVERYHPLCGA